MKHSKLMLLVLLSALVLIVAGCGGSGETPTSAPERETAEAPTEEATDTPEPTDTATATPTGTPTPLPTDTPTPVPSDTPTPTPIPELSVSVMDAENGEAIEGATVELSCSQMGAVYTQETDEDGLASFSPVPEEPCDLALTAAGYEAMNEESLEVAGQMSRSFEMSPLVLAELSVESTFLREGPGTIYGRAGEAEEGDVFEVVGQNEEQSWLLVEVLLPAENGDEEGQGEEGEGEIITAWISMEDVTVTGDLDRVQTVEDPPTPTPAPELPTPTPEVEDTVVVYYISDPNEILGVFPERPFDANAMYNNMLRMRGSLNTMSGALDGAMGGDAAACTAYVNAYNNILYSGVFYYDVPPEWQEIDGIYFISFIYSLDRTRPAYLSCVDAGHVDEFNGNLARVTINQTLSILNPAIDSAAGRL